MGTQLRPTLHFIGRFTPSRVAASMCELFTAALAR
jgi:hypothetical protein